LMLRVYLLAVGYFAYLIKFFIYLRGALLSYIFLCYYFGVII